MSSRPAPRPDLSPRRPLRGRRLRPVRAWLLGALLLGNLAPAAEPAPDDLAARLARLEQAASAERDRLAADLAAIQARLATLEQQSQGPTPPPAVTPPADPVAADPTTNGDAALAAAERRLALLIEQFAFAHQLREQAISQLAETRAQLAELGARQTQAQLELQEAQARAEKAERRYLALEAAQERGMQERERLSTELETARSRLAETLKQTVALDARLAAAEARVGQLEAEASARQPPPAPPIPSTAPEPVAQPAPAVYVVRAEDTLSKISAQVYGDPEAWPRIFDANRDQLGAPDQLAPGMSLVIP